MKPLALLLVIATLLLACNKPKPRHNQITKVQIYTRPCFGDCPVQTISIDSSLMLYYRGEHNVKNYGMFTGKISQGLWDTINIRLEHIHYKSLKAFYPEIYIDGPDYNILIEYNGIKKYIDASMSGLPDSVARAFALIFSSYRLVKLNPAKSPIKFEEFKRQRPIGKIRMPPSLDKR